MSVEEFSAAFPRETGHVEFKEGLGARAIQDAAVAFANSDGGVLIIGVNDSGKVIGRELTQAAEETIHRAIAEVRNPGQYGIHRLLVGETPTLVVSLARRVEGFAQTPSGRVLTRRGPGNVALFDNELLRLVQTRALERFELHDTGRPLEDADRALLEELATTFGWSIDDEDLADRLEEHHLVTPRETLTLAGALYLLGDPTEAVGKAYIEILRYPEPGTEYDKRIEIRGPITEQVSEATAAVQSELGTELVVLGLQRHDLPRLPTVVLREAISNAVAHRSYEDNRSAVRIEIRPDAVTVISPGPLPTPVTEQNIREAQAPRNLALIRALRRFGLAEDAGRGVDVMQDSMRAELLDPPRFHDTGHSVEVSLPVRSAVTARERAWVREVERRGEIEPTDRILLVHASRGEVLTNRRVRELTGLDRVEATRALQRLTRAGFLRQHGARGGSTYLLGGSLEPPAGLRLDPEELKNGILEMALEGPVTNASIRGRLGVDRAEALRLLDDLVNAELLERRGERRGTHYVRIDT